MWWVIGLHDFCLSNLKGPKQLEPSALARKSASSWAILNSVNNSQTLRKKLMCRKVRFLENSNSKGQDFGGWHRGWGLLCSSLVTCLLFKVKRCSVCLVKNQHEVGLHNSEQETPLQKYNRFHLIFTGWHFHQSQEEGQTLCAAKSLHQVRPNSKCYCVCRAK